MTDKELKERILAEIERVNEWVKENDVDDKYDNGVKLITIALTKFINSLPED